MDRSNPYYQQVQLLVQLLPLIADEDCFALKGGTAINLFVRDFPRLSVDIDLVYLPSGDRDEALKAVAEALDRVTERISQTLATVRVTKSYKDKNDALRLVVDQRGATVKIELSPVLCGTVFKPETRTVVEAVEEEFGFAEVRIVAFEDLYAGKLCAALDRQHPRDIFDVKLLLDNEGLTERLKKAFLVYLISHQRPMEELLAPHFKSLDTIYNEEFSGMTMVDISLEMLLEARERIVKEVMSSLKDGDKSFLRSVYSMAPDWKQLGLDDVADLPAVKWKLQNIKKMPEAKRAASLEKLNKLLGV